MSNSVPSFCDSIFERDIDCFLIDALARASDRGFRPASVESKAFLEKAEVLIKAGADINALGTDNEYPKIKRRLASAFVRETSFFDGPSARDVLDFLFSHGFDPTLDDGRAGAEFLISVIRSFDDQTAEYLPDTLRYLLERGCRSDIRMPYLIDEDFNEEADWDLEDHLGELWQSVEMCASNFLALKYIMASYAILSDHQAHKPTDGITPMSDAVGKPCRGLLVPADAEVREIDADTIEIRLARGFEHPTVGLALGDSVLALNRFNHLYCNRRQDDFVSYPFFSECQDQCIRRITLTQHPEVNFIVGLDSSQNLLVKTKRVSQTDENAGLVIRVKRVTDTDAYIESKLVYTKTSCSY